ncbi:FAD-dependent oxidoreductase, partial [Seonamhaeicola marinus]
KQKFKINASHKVKSVERVGDEVIVKADNKKGEEVEFKGDYCLVSVGRSPYTNGLNAEAAGVKLDDRGRVEVNSHLQT